MERLEIEKALAQMEEVEQWEKQQEAKPKLNIAVSTIYNILRSMIIKLDDFYKQEHNHKLSLRLPGIEDYIYFKTPNSLTKIRVKEDLKTKAEVDEFLLELIKECNRQIRLAGISKVKMSEEEIKDLIRFFYPNYFYKKRFNKKYSRINFFRGKPWKDRTKKLCSLCAKPAENITYSLCNRTYSYSCDKHLKEWGNINYCAILSNCYVCWTQTSTDSVRNTLEEQKIREQKLYHEETWE